MSSEAAPYHKKPVALDLTQRSQQVSRFESMLSERVIARHGHCIIMKGPAFAGAERETAMGACRRLGFRYVSERRVTLEAGDGERVMAMFERE